MSPQLIDASAWMTWLKACDADSALISSVIDPEPSREKRTSIALHPPSAHCPLPPPPPALKAPVASPPSPLPPVLGPAPEPPLPLPGSTQRSLRHVRLPSQLPPCVHGQPSLPTGQSSGSSPPPAAQLNDVAIPKVQSERSARYRRIGGS